MLNLICFFLGLMLGSRNRANLFYLYLLLYPFDGSFLHGTGIAVFTLISYAVLLPLVCYIAFDTFVGRKGNFQHQFSTLLIYLGLLYLYIWSRYLVALHPKRNSYFLVLTSGFILICGILYYYDQIKIKSIANICKLLITIELFIVIQQAVFNFEPGLVLKIFDFSQFEHKMILNQDYYRGTGTFLDPNYFALFLGTISSFLLINFSLFDAGVFLLGIAAILLSFSRMGFALGGILLWVFVIKLVKSQFRYQLMALCSILLAGLFISGLLTGNFLPFGFRFDIHTLSNAVAARFTDTSDFDMGGRGFIFKSYFHQIMNSSNIILGLGFLNFQMALQRVTGVNLVAHNEYLQIFADLGIAGVGMILFILYQILKKASLRVTVTQNPYFLTVLIILIGNLFLSTTLYVYVYFFYALYAAYVVQNKTKPNMLTFQNV